MQIMSYLRSLGHQHSWKLPDQDLPSSFFNGRALTLLMTFRHGRLHRKRKEVRCSLTWWLYIDPLIGAVPKSRMWQYVQLSQATLTRLHVPVIMSDADVEECDFWHLKLPNLEELGLEGWRPAQHSHPYLFPVRGDVVRFCLFHSQRPLSYYTRSTRLFAFTSKNYSSGPKLLLHTLNFCSTDGLPEMAATLGPDLRNSLKVLTLEPSEDRLLDTPEEHYKIFERFDRMLYELRDILNLNSGPVLSLEKLEVELPENSEDDLWRYCEDSEVSSFISTLGEISGPTIKVLSGCTTRVRMEPEELAHPFKSFPVLEELTITESALTNKHTILRYVECLASECPLTKLIITADDYEFEDEDYAPSEGHDSGSEFEDRSGNRRRRFTDSSGFTRPLPITSELHLFIGRREDSAGVRLGYIKYHEMIPCRTTRWRAYREEM